MRGVFTADLHLGNELPGRSRFTVIRKIFKYAIKKEADLLVIAGDVYDHLLVSNLIREKFNRWIKKLSEHLTIIIIPGNHDVGNKTTSLAPIAPLVSGNIKLIEKPTVVKLFKKRMLFLPYDRFEEREPRRLIKKFKKFRGGYDFIFGHFSVDGAKTGPSNFALTNEVSRSLLKKYFDAEHIVLGHIHKPQRTKNIIYCGAPDYLNFGERNEKKRFLYYAGNELQSIDTNPAPICQLELTPEGIEGELIDGAVFKIVVKCKKEEVGSMDVKSLVDQVKEIGGRVIKVNWDLEPTKRKRAKHIDFRKSLKSNVKEFIKNFAPEDLRKQILSEVRGVWEEASVRI